MGVTAGGPADRAGLRLGDLIKEVNGKAVLKTPEVRRRHRLRAWYCADYVNALATRVGFSRAIVMFLVGTFRVLAVWMCVCLSFCVC